ncbi:MAG TPA: hypothetical protein VJN71_07155 [Nitrososphaerales archaeon]|nr:hypothetical protein [Nitrososphaerales archaeon]
MNKWFTLPRVGTECFAELRRSNVLYDSKFGFKITGETDVQRALYALNSNLAEGFALQSSCFVCGDLLDEGSAHGAVLCSVCFASEEIYAIYSMKFVELMEKL